jgi:hypothetical protein
VVVGEVAQGLIALIGVAASLLASFFWMLGGRSEEELNKTPFGIIKNRVWGRLIAPLFLGGALCLIATISGTFNLLFLLLLPAYLVSSRVGYGAKTTWAKILRRSIWAVCRTACLLPATIITGSWIVWVTQIVVGLIVAVTWGTTNPEKAPKEELVINFSNCFLAVFTVT